jgi:hypothetical protein
MFLFFILGVYMKAVVRFGSLFCILSSFAVAPNMGWAKDAPVSKSKESEKTKNFGAMPAGFVIVEEDFSLNMKELPLAFMDESISDFAKKNYGEAAGDLKGASQVIKAAETSKVSHGAKIEMKAAVDCLEKTAQALRNNEFKSEVELKSRLGEVAFHKAAYNRLLAIREWEGRHMILAGHDLDASAAALEMSAKWSNKEMTKDSHTDVTTALSVASKLMSGTDWTSSEVDAAIGNLASAERRVGNLILPNKEHASDSPEGL